MDVSNLAQNSGPFNISNTHAGLERLAVQSSPAEIWN
jgi:hypothetical protein